MKTITTTIVLLFLAAGNFVSAQNNVKIKGNSIYIGKSYQFDIYTTGSFQVNEATVKNKNGEIVLTFLLNNKPNGYNSNSYYGNNGFSMNSGVRYQYYYRLADGLGNYCEIASDGLQNIRAIATYLINNNLMVKGELDQEAFVKFCTMHGATFSGGY